MDARGELSSVTTWLRATAVLTGRRWLTLTALAILCLALTVAAFALVHGLALVAAVVLRDWDFGRWLRDDWGRQRLWDALPFLFPLPLQLLAAVVALRLAAWPGLAAAHVAVSGPHVDTRRALALARPRVRGFFGLLLVQQLAVAAGLALLVLPGLAVALWLGFAPFFHAAAAVGTRDAIRGSARLVRGRSWALLGRAAILGLVSLAIALVPLVGWVAAPCFALLGWAVVFRQAAGLPPSG